MTNNYVDDFLAKAEPDDLRNVITELQAEMREMQQAIQRLQRLDELSAEIGAASADSIEYPPFIADEDGILFPQSGDGIQCTESVRMSSEDGGTNIPVAKIEVFHLPTATRIETNGDFETGDLSGWTASGTTMPVVSNDAHGGGYAAYLVGGTSKGTISQRITLSASDRAIFVRFRRKCSGAITGKLSYYDSSDVLLFYEIFYFSETESKSDQYALCTVGIRPTPSSGTIAKVDLTIAIDSLYDTDHALIDDVEIYEGNSATTQYSRLLMFPGGPVFYAGSFQVKDGAQQLINLQKEYLEFYKWARFYADVEMGGDVSVAGILTPTTLTIPTGQPFGTLAGNGNRLTVAAGGTSYAGFGFTGLDANSINVRIKPAVDCRLINFYIETRSAQPATGSLVIDLIVSGVAQHNITIPAGSAAGIFSDIVTAINVSAINNLNIRCVNNASGVSAQIAGFSIGQYSQ